MPSSATAPASFTAELQRLLRRCAGRPACLIHGLTSALATPNTDSSADCTSGLSGILYVQVAKFDLLQILQMMR